MPTSSSDQSRGPAAPSPPLPSQGKQPTSTANPGQHSRQAERTDGEGGARIAQSQANPSQTNERGETGSAPAVQLQQVTKGTPNLVQDQTAPHQQAGGDGHQVSRSLQSPYQQSDRVGPWNRQVAPLSQGQSTPYLQPSGRGPPIIPLRAATYAPYGQMAATQYQVDRGHAQAFGTFPANPYTSVGPGALDRGCSRKREKRRRSSSSSSSSEDTQRRRARRRHRKRGKDAGEGQFTQLLLALKEATTAFRGEPHKVNQTGERAEPTSAPQVLVPHQRPEEPVSAQPQLERATASSTSKRMSAAPSYSHTGVTDPISMVNPAAIPTLDQSYDTGIPHQEGDELEMYASDQLSDSEGPPSLDDFTDRSSVAGSLRGHEDTDPAGFLSPEEYTSVIKELNRALEIEPGVSAPPSGEPCTWARIGTTATRGEETPGPTLTLTQDVWDRCAKVATRRSLSSYPRLLNKQIRVPDAQYNKLIKTPGLPPVAWDRLVLFKKAKVVQTAVGAAPTFRFSETARDRADADLRAFDRTARFGLKLVALQRLLGEWFTNHAGSASQPVRALMCRALRMSTEVSCDQFTRVAVQATVLRRRNIVPMLGMSDIATGALQGAPLLGGDLFGDTFQRILEEDVTRRDNFRKTTVPVNPPKQPQGQRATFRPPRQYSSRGRGRGAGGRNHPGTKGTRPRKGSRTPRSSQPGRSGRGRGRGSGSFPRGR